MFMKKVTARKFKTDCAKILDEVCVTRQPVLIYKGRRIVAKLIPFDARPKDIFGCLAGVMEIVGNIESPQWPTEG
jgi:antitoxin (DNA-binding transcriptional repressor) of toxin-antitoxin stability system